MITSLSNDKVKFVRALSDRKQRVRAGRFVIEGARLIDDALAAGVKPDWVFCAEQLTPRARATLAQLKSLSIELNLVSDSVLQSCSGTETPQGLLAVTAFPYFKWPDNPTLILIADALRDPGNLGTLLRSAAAAGIDGVLLSPETVDAYSPKVVRGAMGAHFRLPIVQADWALIAQTIRDLKVYLASAESEYTYSEVNWTLPSALIVGGEANGASEEAMKLATAHISIPLSREVESLNAAVAASVILFEARRQRSLDLHP